MKTNDLKNLILENSTIVENALKQYLPEKTSQLIDAMSYSVFAGGKRLRPFIVLETYKAFSGDVNPKRALPFACALEMIQTYSLIHDDLPCMDNDDYRRGKLTNHRVFGEANALLAGDALLTYAFEIIADNSFVSDKSVRLATKALAQCSGVLGMVGGQAIDLNGNFNSFDALKEMYALKTGALIKCAVLLGYYAYTDSPSSIVEKELECFALNLGVAFQIRDDVLDVISNSTSLGKPVGSDEKNGKITALTYFSPEQAQKEIEILTKASLDSLERCLDTKASVLIALSKYLIEREK